jgi:hypothetical protein
VVQPARALWPLSFKSGEPWALQFVAATVALRSITATSS